LFKQRNWKKDKLVALIEEKEAEFRDIKKTATEEKAFMEELRKMKNSLKIMPEMEKLRKSKDAIFTQLKEKRTESKK